MAVIDIDIGAAVAGKMLIDAIDDMDALADVIAICVLIVKHVNALKFW